MNFPRFIPCFNEYAGMFVRILNRVVNQYPKYLLYAFSITVNFKIGIKIFSNLDLFYPPFGF